MSGPIYSDDGYWMWNGTEWIPATQAQNAVPAQQIDQSVVTNVAAEVGVQPEEVAAVAPHFDLNQDGQIDQDEMMQAAQSIANPVNVAAPIPNNISAPNPNVFTATTTKKGFDWKEKKALLIGAIVTITIAIGVLIFFLMSGNPIVGTWVISEGEFTFNKDGTLSSYEGTGTWEIDGNNLIYTIKEVDNGTESSITTTLQFELSDNDNVLWWKVTSMVDQDGNDWFALINSPGANTTEISCALLLSKNIADNSTYNSVANSYLNNKPSWCTS